MNLSKRCKISLLFGLIIFLSQEVAYGQTSEMISSKQKLFSRLQSEQIIGRSDISSLSDSDFSLQELLRYYKKRSSIKHPVNNSIATPTEKDIKYANDALKHIFVGQPAYESYFCGSDINWNSRPVPDLEWVWQLNRMYFWNSMGKVYAKTGDERYAEAWCAQLVDWTQKNPRDEEHHYAWRSIEAGKRGHSWTAQFQQFIHSEHFTEEVLLAFLNSCYDHAEYLMTVYRSGSNWSLMEAEGLAFIAMTFPEFQDAKKWQKEAIWRLNNEINVQVHADGHQKELAMGYHLGSIRWFYRTYEMAKLNGLDDLFPKSFVETIQDMCEVPMKLCLPDGTNAQFGDSWAGEPGQHASFFQRWADEFKREDFLFLATGGGKGEEPDSTAYALRESGFYSMRSGWDQNATCLILKCGSDGGGHCQPDNGTFTLAAGGRTLMPDAGSYIYHGDPEGRKWFRQTKVHQTLTLNGKNSRYAPKLLLWKPGKETDVLVVENESYENLIHRRSVFFVDKRFFVIVDEAIGPAVGDVDIHFQLAPVEAVFDPSRFSVRSDFEDGMNIFVQTEKQKGLELSEEEGWLSFEYTKKERRPAFQYRLKKSYKRKNIRFITLIAPYENKVPDIKIKVSKKSKPGSKNLKLGVVETNKIGTKTFDCIANINL